MSRIIYHLDMDAFYASVEQRDHPALRGRPVIVGAPPTQRGVVCAASYEARKFGVHSAMPSVTASRLCPKGVFVRPRMDHYREESLHIMKLASATGAVVEQMSLDEAYLDLSAICPVEDPDAALLNSLPLARQLKQRIRSRRQLTATIGIAANKLLAKIASDHQKPDGLTLITEADKIRFLRPLPVRALYGVGKVTEQALNQAGVRTVGDLQDHTGDLRALVGSFGLKLKQFAFGQDHRPLELGDDIKSISGEETFLQDTEDRKVLRACLREQAQDICVHCYNYWRQDRGPVLPPAALSRGEILALVRKIRRDTPLQQVALSGGEPLLRPDLPEIATDLAAEGLGVVVITNAALLSNEVLRRFPPGVLFEFALFSVDEKLHDRIAGCPGAFRGAIAGVQRTARRKFRLALACVISRLNFHDVFRTIELGIALEAEAVLFNRINLSRMTQVSAGKLVPSVEQQRHALAAAEDAARRYGIAVAVSVPIPPCVLDLRPYRHLHFGWCPRGGVGAYYTISCNGLLRPCNHSSAILGDLRTEGFAEIVTRERTRAYWRPLPAECRNCSDPLRDSCRGGCLAASYECCGSGGRIDPFVASCR